MYSGSVREVLFGQNKLLLSQMQSFAISNSLNKMFCSKLTVDVIPSQYATVMKHSQQELTSTLRPQVSPYFLADLLTIQDIHKY